MYIPVRILIHVHIFIIMHIHIYIYIYTPMKIHVHIHSLVHLLIHKHTCVYAILPIGASRKLQDGRFTALCGRPGSRGLAKAIADSAEKAAGLGQSCAALCNGRHPDWALIFLALPRPCLLKYQAQVPSSAGSSFCWALLSTSLRHAD